MHIFLVGLAVAQKREARVGETLTDGEFMATDAEKSEYQVSYLVTAPPLKTGKNFIEWSLTSVPANPVQLYGLRLKVEYKAGG